MTTWATIDDVYTRTGVQTSPDVVAQAQGVVDLYSGVSALVDADLSVRDRRLLRSAVAYQAAFIESQPGLFGRVAVRSMSQDGVSFSVNESQGQPDPDALLLAPLAGRCIGSLTWRRRRSWDVRRGPYRATGLVGVVRSWETDNHSWRPM